MKKLFRIHVVNNEKPYRIMYDSKKNYAYFGYAYYMTSETRYTTQHGVEVKDSEIDVKCYHFGMN